MLLFTLTGQDQAFVRTGVDEVLVSRRREIQPPKPGSRWTDEHVVGDVEDIVDLQTREWDLARPASGTIRASASIARLSQSPQPCAARSARRRPVLPRRTAE